MLQKFSNFYMIHLVRITGTYHLRPMNLLKYMIKESVAIPWVTSICTALDERQLINAPYLFFFLWPFLTAKGPNILIPQYLNGGSSLILSLGRSSTCYCWNLPLRILHLTHFDIVDLTAALHLITQYPEVLTALIVIPLPAWATWLWHHSMMNCVVLQYLCIKNWMLNILLQRWFTYSATHS